MLGRGPHPEQCHQCGSVTAAQALHSHGAGRWEMGGLRKRPGHAEVKPELPAGISHLSLGQRFASSMAAAAAAARPTTVQDLTQEKPRTCFLRDCSQRLGGLGTGCSHSG